MNPQENQISRRDFLKLSASGALGLVLSKIGIDGALASGENKAKMVHGVEVYGLDKPIASTEEAKNLTFALDLDFERKLPIDIKGKNRWEQREYAMPRDKRLVQFVVTESTYKEFLSKKAETGVDYVEWVQIHLDLMNRFSKTQPGLENFRVELKRVIVVSDDFENNPIDYSKDIDAIRFNDGDYRDKDYRSVDGGKASAYRWFATIMKNGDLVLKSEYVFVDNSYSEEVVLPETDDSLQRITNTVKVDWGEIHEALMHGACNLPDEYTFDCIKMPFNFKEFQYRTWSFQRPYLSLGLKASLLRNVSKNIRGYYTDPRSIGRAGVDGFDFYGEVPQKVSFQLNNVGNFRVYRSGHSVPDYYSAKTFSDVAGIMRNSDGKFVMPKESFEPQSVDGKKIYSTIYVIKTSSGDKNKELYFPVSLLNIPAIFGVKDANYKIDFTGYEPSTEYSGKQVMEYVEANEMPTFMNKKSQAGEPLYALMAIPGTQTWAVWSFVKS